MFLHVAGRKPKGRASCYNVVQKDSVCGHAESRDRMSKKKGERQLQDSKYSTLVKVGNEIMTKRIIIQ